jgi:hypothetical protein
MRGVKLDPLDEYVAFEAWKRQRMVRLHALRALVAAPIDAEVLGNERIDGKHDSHIVQLKKAIHEMMPELAEAEAASLERQKKVLERFKDSPIRLGLDVDRRGTLSVSMDNPL